MTGQEIAQRTPQQELLAFVTEPSRRAELAAVLPENVSEAKFMRALKNALISDPTGHLVNANKSTLLLAASGCAMYGLLPDGNDAVILPYWDNKAKEHRAQLIVMRGGKQKIAGEYGWALIAHVVYENDSFDPDYETHRANHRPTRLGQERGPVIGAYAIAEHRDGRKVGPVVMDVADIEKIRAKSKQPNGQLWTEWYERACEKTLAGQIMKRIPWDPKDRERVMGFVARDEENAETILYGDRPESPLSPTVGAGETTPQSDSPPHNVDLRTGEISEQPFDGDEPETVEGEIEEPPVVFLAGAHQGKTLDEVYALGADGIAYLKVAYKKAKTEPLRSGLDAFAEEHPEIKS